MTPYEIGSIVIGAVGACATFCAVIVALWQTKYANRKRLKFCFIENNTACDANFSMQKSYVGMSITNIGNKNVVIASWGIKKPNDFLFILTNLAILDNANCLDKAVSVKTPYVLEVEQNITFYYAKDLFCRQIQNLINSGEIKKNKPIHFFVNDSTGKSYIVKSKKVAEAYLN